MNPWEMYSAQKQPAEQPKNPWEMYAPIEKKEKMRGEVSKEQETPVLNRAVNLGAAYMDARTLGLGPKIAAGVGTLPAKLAAEGVELFTGNQAPSISDIYKSGVNMYSGLGKQAFKDDPILATGATIAGGLKTGGQIARTKAGTKAFDWASRGGLGAKVLKGGAIGATGGAVSGAGSSDVGEELSGALQGGALGFGIGAGAPVVGNAINKLNTKTIIPSSEQIREKGGELFKLAEQKGGILKPEVADEFYNKVLSIKPQTEAGQVFKGSSPVTDILNNVSSLKGKPLTLDAAKEVDEALGDMAYSTMDKFGKLSAEGKKFLDMQTALRKTIEKADENMIIGGKEGFEAVKEARKLWAASLRLRDVEKIIQNAERMEQPSTSIKAGFRTLLRNGDRIKGYTPQEVKALEKAAKTGVVTDFFRLAGSGLVPIGSGFVGFSAGPIGGVMGSAAGFAVQQGSKAIANARQLSRAQNAAKTIAEKSGMVVEQKRLPIPTLRAILGLPPQEAKKILEKVK